jgi:hypothetical protein
VFQWERGRTVNGKYWEDGRFRESCATSIALIIPLKKKKEKSPRN